MQYCFSFYNQDANRIVFLKQSEYLPSCAFWLKKWRLPKQAIVECFDLSPLLSLFDNATLTALIEFYNPT